MKIILTVIFSLFLVDSAFALKPCPGQEQLRNTKWVIVATLIDRDENFKPYPNCSARDRSECAIQDLSELTFKVESVEQGNLGVGKLKLQASICSNLIPKNIGQNYKLYGNDKRYFKFAEEIKNKDKNEILEK